jgi:disulfide bond formation protein DsbB
VGCAGWQLGLLGFGVAAYQTWMQAYPELAPACSFTDPNAIERLVDWLGTELPSMFLATGFCTSRDWELFGLSMANWSVLVFAGIVGFAVMIFLRKREA